MGTNYYRIPTEEEIKNRQMKLAQRVKYLDLSVANISNFFSDIEKNKNEWDKQNCWEEFTHELQIHIGKNSGGWKFLFNHNNWKYYENMEELKSFIKSGRLINEYGEEQDIDEFWKLIEAKQKDSEMINGKQYYEEGVGKEDAWGNKMAKEQNYYEEIHWGYRFSTSIEFS